MDCSVCAAASGADPLCPFHRRLLATCPDLTPEQIRTRRLAQPPTFGLIDAFGLVHPLAGSATVGRNPDACDVAVLHASVSSEHARIIVTEETVTIEDLGSLNGTFVDDQRVGRTTIAGAEVRVRFGAVSFVVSLDAVRPSGKVAVGRTVPHGGAGSVGALTVGESRWTLSLGNGDALLEGEGGRLALSLMEGRLLCALLERAGVGVRDFVATSELVAAVGFGSRAADNENIRELVRRLRRKLQKVDLGDLIESRRNAGYRLAEHAVWQPWPGGLRARR